MLVYVPLIGTIILADLKLITPRIRDTASRLNLKDFASLFCISKDWY